LNFWLLVVATLAVNAVAVRWLSLVGELSIAAYFYEALISGQLAIVCLWSMFSARRALWGWIGAVAAVLAAALTTVYATQLSFVEACGVYGGYVTALAAALWVLKRTAFWRRLCGAGRTEWKYSMAILLAVMTLIAVLITSLRNSQLVSSASELWKFFAAMTLGDVILAVATTIIWAWTRERQWLPHWWPRLGVVWGFAGILGVIEHVCAVSGILGVDVATTLHRRAPAAEFVAYTLAMSLVIFVWLELAPIVPVAPRAGSPSHDQAE
jgi:hypothetical protein